jgi:phosphatidylinositol alpha-1,6-mannosyltransferase
MVAAGRKTCLLITNLFPPAVGGSAEVYAALAAHACGEIVILTSSHNYQTGWERPGWREYDHSASYPVHRLVCIRPFFRKAYHGLSYRLHEVVAMFKLVATVVLLVLRYRVRAICVADDETLGWLVVISRFILARRTLIYCHGDDLQGDDKDVVRRRRWLRLAHHVVAANRYAATLLASRFAVASDRVLLIENGVDLALFHPAIPPAAFVTRHGLERRRVILTVTRLVARKGVDMALKALPAVISLFPDVLYLIVGDGPQRAELQAFAAKLGIADWVKFTGAVSHDDTVDFYRSADLVLLPNRKEKNEADGLPLVFLEAAACAKPAIGGRAGGTAEAVIHGSNGLVVDGQDVEAITAAICNLLRDGNRRQAMGRKGLAMAQNWGWETRAGKFLATCRG